MAVHQAEEVSALQALVEYLALMLVAMQWVEEESRGLNWMAFVEYLGLIMVAMPWVEAGWG